MKEVIKEEKPFSCKYCKKKNNGSLFTYLPATVTVNGLENEMSSELRFQGRKWGGRKQGTPSRPEGSRGVTPA